MYSIIAEIAKRCHQAAEKRGKDTSAAGCIACLGRELAEYWAAVDENRVTTHEAITRAEQTEDDADFCVVYEKELHNTVTDELADVLITAATWNETANQGEDFKPERSIDVLLASGAVSFICNQITGPRDVDTLRRIVNLKMHYNELRKD